LSVEDRMRSQAAPYLESGETIEVVFGALVARYTDTVVVVTDRRIIVFDARSYVHVNIKGVRKELPRSTRFGTPYGVFYPVPMVGESEVVPRKWFKALIAADEAEDTRGETSPT